VSDGASGAAGAPLLEMDGIEQYYGGSHILRGVSLLVPSGSCTCLMGRNGVGKTTLLRVLMGLLPARAGRVVFAGEDLTRADTRARARRGIGYVPQGREIFARLTVEENLRVSLGVHRRRTLPARIFELFPVLREMLGRRGGDLSGGQQQQLAIARALVLEPKLLVLDEPCEGIQPNIVHGIGEVLTRLRRETGLAVLLVEQKLPFARRVADRFYLMERGAVVADGAIGALGEDLIQRHLVV
jgi:urea transport system ATP-binding protein